MVGLIACHKAAAFARARPSAPSRATRRPSSSPSMAPSLFRPPAQESAPAAPRRAPFRACVRGAPGRGRPPTLGRAPVGSSRARGVLAGLEASWRTMTAARPRWTVSSTGKAALAKMLGNQPLVARRAPRVGRDAPPALVLEQQLPAHAVVHLRVDLQHLGGGQHDRHIAGDECLPPERLLLLEGAQRVPATPSMRAMKASSVCRAPDAPPQAPASGQGHRMATGSATWFNAIDPFHGRVEPAGPCLRHPAGRGAVLGPGEG